MKIEHLACSAHHLTKHGFHFHEAGVSPDLISQDHDRYSTTLERPAKLQDRNSIHEWLQSNPVSVKCSFQQIGMKPNSFVMASALSVSANAVQKRFLFSFLRKRTVIPETFQSRKLVSPLPSWLALLAGSARKVVRPTISADVMLWQRKKLKI